MTAIGAVLARSVGHRIVLIFMMGFSPIPLAMAQEQAQSEVLEYKGTLVPALEGEVAPRLDGLLVNINFTAGQLVKKGDLLFEFGTRDKELSLALARRASNRLRHSCAWQR